MSALVRRMVDDLAPEHRGGEEFGLDSALPDAADQVLRSTAQSLADRFDIVFERLVTDASDTFEALTLAGYPLPPELKVPMQMAWARRLETDLVALARSYSALTYRSARELAEQARVQGLNLMTPDVVAALRAATLRAVTTAVEERQLTAVEPAIAMVRLALLLDPRFDLSRAQDQVYFALVGASDESAAVAASARRRARTRRRRPRHPASRAVGSPAVQPADIARVVAPGEPRLSPDGALLAFTRLDARPRDEPVEVADLDRRDRWFERTTSLQRGC